MTTMYFQNMEIVTNDYTFTRNVGLKLRYGSSSDCYSRHYHGQLSKCGTKGYFDIDTTGTGMIIDESVKSLIHIHAHAHTCIYLCVYITHTWV